MTQAQLAEAAGVRQGDVSSIERLQFARVRLERVQAIAARLGLDDEAVVPADLRGQSIAASHTVIKTVNPSALIGMDQRVLIENKSAPMEEEEIKEAIHEGLQSLTAREETVVGMLFGIDGHQERSMGEIARELGISRSTVCQTRDRAIRKLRRPDRAAPIAGAVWGSD